MKVQIGNGKFIWSHVKHRLESQQLNYIHPFYFKSGKLYVFFDCQGESMKKGEQWGENERSGMLKGSKDLSCQRKQFDELWVKQNLVSQRNTWLKVQGESAWQYKPCIFLNLGSLEKKKKDTFGKVKTQLTSCLLSEKSDPLSSKHIVG